MGPSKGPPPPIWWSFEKAPSVDKSPQTPNHSPQTSPGKLPDKDADSSSSDSSPDPSVEGESPYLAFVDHHPEFNLRGGPLRASTSSPRSASEQLVAASKVAAKEQSVEPQTAQVEEQARPAAQRAFLAVPSVSVKSRIAAFEKKSPTASTFGPSPPRVGKVDPTSRSFSVNTAGDLDVAHIDLSGTSSSVLPSSLLEDATTKAPRSGCGSATPTAPESARRSNQTSGPVQTLPTPLTAVWKDHKTQRVFQNTPLPSTAEPLQTPSPSPGTDTSVVTASALESTEQPKTPQLGKASLALPTLSNCVGEESLPDKSSPQRGLQTPSFSWLFLPVSPLERVRQNELPGPRPKQEHALARKNRSKPQSRLSQVFCAESPEKDSAATAPTEPSRFDTSERGQPSSAPEGHSGVERSSSTRQNRAATLRSLEGLETLKDQETLSKARQPSLGEESRHSVERCPPSAPVPYTLKSNSIGAAGAEATSLDEHRPTPERPDSGHPNLANFSFRFDTAEGKDPEIVEEGQCKCTPVLLPSLLPRSGYGSLSIAPVLPNAGFETHQFLGPALEGASVSDFEKPSRPTPLSAAPPVRGTGYPLPTGSWGKPPFLGQPYQLQLSEPTSPWWSSVTGEQPSYLATPTEDIVLPIESPEKLLRHQQPQQSEERRFTDEGIACCRGIGHSTRLPSQFSLESSKTPTLRPANAGQQPLKTSRLEEPEETTPRITRALIQRRLRLSDSGSESDSDTMDRLRPESAIAVSHHRREAMRLAKAQETMVIEKCRRSGSSIPEYTFDELIGKGSFGRVYKCRNIKTRNVVAVKVIDIDESDYRAHGEEKDEQIRAFQKEIKILRQAQESGAPNLNQIIEALPVHSQLWLVCEYCPGGSVKTLMRATNDKLIEKYIVVIARELGMALKGLHAAGILHRDIKAANVLIHEEGRLQLCDFGVATVMETKLDKRRTFIGTLHWMPPEMWDQKPEYSDEVDVWAFGCVIYECAVGKPPNSDLREPQQLKSRMRRLNKPIELPENEYFPDALRSLVSYTLTPDAKKRPSMGEVLTHEYLVNTEESHPTSILTELVNVYYTWLHGGGQRASLFIKGGAAVSEAPGALSTSDDEWNFSTTVDFEKRLSTILDIDIDIPEVDEPQDRLSTEGEVTPKAMQDSTPEQQSRELTQAQKANFEARVRRGADLSNVFDLNKPNYEYKTKTDFRPIQERRGSDLPLRVMAEDRPPSIASNEIDLGDFDSSNYATVAPLTKLIDASTIRAKRDDLKLSRESSASKASLNINVSRAEDDYLAQEGSSDRPATQDFSFPPKEWQQDKSKALGPEPADTGYAQAKKSAVRKTMDWSFDTAMSETETEEPEPTLAEDSRAKKHDTMAWSFPQAMAEAGTSPNPSVTPARPAQMIRTTTMPVTSSEMDAAEADVPRPSTAVSETVSETSLASFEADPFALDQDAHGYPAPGALDQRGISSYYHTEGDTLSPEHTVPYNTTAAGPAPYPMGAPARIGEEGFPGPSTSGAAAASMAQSAKKQKKKRRVTRPKKSQTLTSDEELPVTSSSPDSASPGPSGRRYVTMPEIAPPAAEALGVKAAPELLERELGSMLGTFGSVLNAAGRVMGIGRRSRRGSRRQSSSEWESEE